MGATYEDALLDFDINYLNQNTNNDISTLIAKNEKLKYNFCRLKSRIIKTDEFIKKYYAKKEQCEEAQKIIATAKEECIQLRIELKNSLETIAKGENNHQILKDAYDKLEETCNHFKNSYEAQISHTNQLQLLLKRKDAIIESIKNESKVEKSSTKDNEKKVSLLMKEKDILLKDLNVLAGLVKKTLGNRNLKQKYKAFLRKYDKSNGEDHNDCSDGENEIFEDDLSTSSNMVKKPHITSPDLSSTDFDNDYSNEIVSIDTGRGSSLAFSEKGLLSPDYYLNDSPLTRESIDNKTRTNVSIATSPIYFDEKQGTVACLSPAERVDAATSPITILIDTYSDCNPEFFSLTEIDTPVPACSTNEELQSNTTEIESKIVITIDEISDDTAALEDTSFTQDDERHDEDCLSAQENVCHEDTSFTQDDECNDEECQNAQENICLDTTGIESLDAHEFNKNNSDQYPQHTEEKQCLELNSSNNLHVEKETDCEVQMILTKMQVNYRALSPIPRTPALMGCTQSSNLSNSFSEHIATASSFETRDCVPNENPVTDSLKANILAIRNAHRQKLVNSCEIMAITDAIDHLLSTTDCSKAKCFDSILNNVQKYLNATITSNFNRIMPSSILEPPQVDSLSVQCNQSPTPRQTEYSLKSPEVNKMCQISLPRLQDDQIKQLIRQDVPEEVPKTSGKSVNMDDSNNNIETSPPTKNKDIMKPKSKKLSKLEKLKINIKPKCKIRSETPSLAKLRNKQKRIALTPKNLTTSNNSVSLNDKNAYAKAVRIMAELNSKNASKSTKSLKDPSPTIVSNRSDQSKKVTPQQRTEVESKHDFTNNYEPDKNMISKVTTKSDEQHYSTFNKYETWPREKINLKDKQIRKSLESSPQLVIEVTPFKILADSEVQSAVNDNETSPRVKINHKPSSNNPESIPKPAREDLSSKLDIELPEHNESTNNSDKASPRTTLNSKKARKSLESFLKPEIEVSLSKVTAESIRNLTQPNTTLNSNETSKGTLSLQKRVGETVESLPKPLNDLLPSKDNFELQSLNDNAANCDIIPPRTNLTSKRSRKSIESSLTPEVEVWLSNATDESIEDLDSALHCSTKGTETVVSSPKSLKEVLPSKNIFALQDNYDSNGNCDIISPKTKLNPKRGSKTPESSPKLVKEVSPYKLAYKLDENVNENSNPKQMSPNTPITTRSKRKNVDESSEVLKIGLPMEETKNSKDEIIPMKRHRRCSNEPEINCKRILRSSKLHLRLSTEGNADQTKTSVNSNKSVDSPMNEIKINDTLGSQSNYETSLQPKQLDKHDNVISYDDLDLFSDEIQCDKDKEKVMPSTLKQLETNPLTCHPKDSILCCMIQKYGVKNVKLFAKKAPESVIKQVWQKFEQGIAKIIELPSCDTKNIMDKLVADLKKLNYKHFISGLMKYLTQPERKAELYNKVCCPPAPPMTKSEQVLLYVITHLKTHWPSVDIVDAILTNIEYTLFSLNRTPEFDVIESTSHFYAILCRYVRAKSRLRLFVLDAMYCIQYKSVPLIKQCLDVWMHIIPLAHMGIAKTTMVTCLVYLLHFYKCEDKFKRVQEIRSILSRKYFYQITDWNEPKILEMFRNSIKELKDIPIERKMLRLALIIIAKRHGPQWCQNNIIKNLLIPLIEKENVSNGVKEFCISMIGPLMKPYPVDMKVHCEIAMNQLTDLLKNDPSPQIEEAVITSMMYLNRHNQYNINRTLLTRKMKPMSPELEGVIRDYVRCKPLKMWMSTLSKMNRH